MIECQKFHQALLREGLDFYAGVPDSLLKNFCAYLDAVLPPSQHIITANEGCAVGLAAGYHMATGKIPVVYMQNSGIGNTVNPLLSLMDPDVYQMPVLLLIGWRGEPGVKDEPQHKKQGRVLLSMLDSMEIPYRILDAESDFLQSISDAARYMKKNHAPFALVIRKNTFSDYKSEKKNDFLYTLTRETVIESLLNIIEPADAIVSTTGKASRELYELRKKRGETDRADFLTVGSMGHCSQIALGVALASDRKVYCIDGDGAILMHMGGMASIGRLKPENYYHIMINNGAHESVGGQSTGAFAVNWCEIARTCGYAEIFYAESLEELENLKKELAKVKGPVFIEIRTAQGSRKDLGRPQSTPIENKEIFMKVLGQ